MAPSGAISQELIALLEIAVAARAASKPRQAAAPAQRSSGSGFFISTAGHIITNRHVIGGCGRVTVNIDGVDSPASVEQVDAVNDLALLKASTGTRAPATFRQSRRANLGEWVIVAGYPLGGLLSSEMSATTGTISALAGISDNPRVVQITAPVQSGNSGGPLLDKSGQVIGVVVSKLNAAKVYQVTGDFPQNINFAIKGSLVRGFLDIHGVDYGIGSSDAAVGSEAVAAMAQDFVVSVECWEQKLSKKLCAKIPNCVK
jgi:S1-C subfamily serine protease